MKLKSDFSLISGIKCQKLFPGGVNSPVRSFGSVGGVPFDSIAGTPIVFSHGKGKKLFDVDGNSYVDFCSSWGPLILGYSHPVILKALAKQIKKSVTFGAPTELECSLAEKMKSFVPELEMLRFVNSGTEATMSALRVARAATGRSKFLKFEGCYHGHADMFLIKGGSGLSTFGIAASAGVPHKVIEDTLVVPYNDVNAVQRVFEEYGHEIAAIIVEPVAANMGLVVPTHEFLNSLRTLTHQYNSILIFDEVMTGFRLARGGACEFFGITPDMWIFGKIMGGGLPAAAYGGKQSIMENLAPIGSVYQAGTLSGNPLAMAAGLATLETIEKLNVYEALEEKGQMLDRIVDKYLSNAIEDGLLQYVRIASFFCFFFGISEIPKNYTDVCAANMETFKQVYHAWIENGIYFGPSGFEVGFLSYAHTKHDLNKCVQTIAKTVY